MAKRAALLLVLWGVLTGGPAMGQDLYQFVPPVQHDQADIARAWADWQAAYVTSNNAGPGARQRVVIETDFTTTYSESQAYGLLLAAQFDDQSLFDNLWLFAADHLNRNGLMAWITTGHGEVQNWGAATDADLDMALALMMACHKQERGEWPPSRYDLDYCALAHRMLDAIWENEIDHPGPGPAAGLDNNPGYELLPGDSWCLECDFPRGIVNLSYFSPGYFRVFADFTGNEGWFRVIERMYAITEGAQSQGCSGLVPNWNTYDGQPQRVDWQPDTATLWAWDAARFSWRIGLDRQWYDSAPSREVLNRIGSFFGSVGIDEIWAVYRLDGTPVNNFHNSYFTGSGAVALWAAPQPQPIACGQATGMLRSTTQQGYAAVVRNKDDTSFSDSWRLFYLLLMTAQFDHPYQPDDTIRPTQTPTPAPTQTPSPTNAPPPTSTPTLVPDTVAAMSSPMSVPATVVPAAPSSDQGQGAALQMEIRREGADDGRQAQFRYRLSNLGDQPVANVAVRFYFSPENDQPLSNYVLDLYWDSSNTAGLGGPFDAGEQAFFTITYGTGALQPGAAWEYTGGLHLADWQPLLNTANDWWRTGLQDSFVPTTNLPVFVNEALAVGRLP